MTAKAFFTDDHRRLRPGEQCTLTLSVTNLAPHEQSWAIMPTGLTANWVTVQAPTVSLRSGATMPVAVDFEPPDTSSTAAGPTEVMVKLVPLTDPGGEVVTAETLVDIAVFDRRELNALHPVRRGRRRATFEFLLENRGNGTANCRLQLDDPSGRVEGSFDPPAIGVAPGGSSLIRLRTRAIGSGMRWRDRELPFRVEAVEPDHPTVATRATMVQIPTVSGEAIGRLATVAAVTALGALAWFGVIRPEVRSLARQAVDERVSEVADGNPATPDPLPVPDSDGGDGGDDPLEIVIDQTPGVETLPVAPRLEVVTTAGGVGADAYQVPDGFRFDIVDIVLMNPNGDLGRAELLRGDEVVYQWDLGLMSMPNEYQPRQSPLPIDPGGQVSLRLTCEAAGSLDADGCQVAVLLGGSLIAQ